MKARPGNNKAVLLTASIKADAGGSFPTEIELAKTGEWNTPWHGDFKLTTADFDEAIKNFEAGIYRVQGTEPLPGSLDHDGGAAAFRITNIYRRDDTLWASVTWTALGQEKLERDEYRYVSFEYNTIGQPLENPEKAGDFIANVLTGGTLTNDPLFKKLKPVMASAKVNHEGEDMKLAELLAKKIEDLTDEENTFIADHEAELTVEQRLAYDLETDEEKEAREAAEKVAAEEKAAADKEAEEKEEAEKLKASANGGLTAGQIKQLQADAKAGREAQQELLRTKLAASVKSHIDRGAIKSDQSDSAVELLMASSDAQRPKLEAFMAALPENKLITSAEAGKGGEGEEQVELTKEEKEFAANFNISEDEVAEFKKSKEGKE